MPLTPFHFTSGLFFGTILRKFLSLPIFLIGTVLPDVEPAVIILLHWGKPYLSYPHHGIVHSFLVGIISAILIALIFNHWQEKIGEWIKFFERRKSFLVVFFSSLLGYWLHILFDSLMHYDVFPFWPLKINPFLRLITFNQQYFLISILSVIGFILFAINFYQSKNQIYDPRRSSKSHQTKRQKWKQY